MYQDYLSKGCCILFSVPNRAILDQIDDLSIQTSKQNTMKPGCFFCFLATKHEVQLVMLLRRTELVMIIRIELAMIQLVSRH